MRKIPGLILILLAVISASGCAGIVSIPDENQLVSSYRALSGQPDYSICDFKTAGSNPAGNRNAEGLDPDAIRLLNWNVYKGTDENWANEFRRLSRYSDIVALQEAQLHPEFKAGLKQSKLHWDLTTAFTYADAETGVLLGSTVRSGAICAQHAVEPLINIPKSALVTKYPVKGTDITVMVANIHMINFTFGTIEYSEQASRLNKILQQHSGPIIVTGDFNTWSDARKAIIMRMVNNLGLEEVTYSEDHRMTIFGNPLDHIYYRGLVAVKADTEEVVSSDHNPMLVTFRLSSL